MANENHFTNRLSSKTNTELQKIIESREYVIDAKLAAKWILENRGKESDSIPPKKILPKTWVPGRNRDPESRKYHINRLFMFGISSIVIAFYINFVNMITSEKSLIELQGTIRESQVLVVKVSSRNRYGYTSESRKASLLFTLNESSKLFKLVENIGQDYSHQEFNLISKSLENSKTISVWINKSQSENIEPKVFQIHADGRTLLDFQKVKNEHNSIFIYTLLIGIITLILALYSKYPVKIRAIFGFKTKL